MSLITRSRHATIIVALYRNPAPPAGTVSSSEVSRMFDLTGPQTEVLLEILAALSLSNGGMHPQGHSSPGHSLDASGSGAGAMQQTPAAPIGQERVFMHELSMFLLAQLFSREAVRPDAVEYWPDPATGLLSGVGGAAGGGEGPMSFSRGSSGELMSPTRQLTKSAMGGEWSLSHPPAKTSVGSVTKVSFWRIFERQLSTRCPFRSDDDATAAPTASSKPALGPPGLRGLPQAQPPHGSGAGAGSGAHCSRRGWGQ